MTRLLQCSCLDLHMSCIQKREQEMGRFEKHAHAMYIMQKHNIMMFELSLMVQSIVAQIT